MKEINYYCPNTIEDAMKLLLDKEKTSRVFAGGTDLLVQLNGGRRTADSVIDIKNINELKTVEHTSNGGLILGASVPCHVIYNDEQIIKKYPGLIDSVSMIGGTQIQGRASLGGNLCNAAPSADGVPPLIALGGECIITGPSGTRTVSAAEFCTAPGKTILHSDEFLVSLKLPSPKANSGSRYIRFIPRNEMDIAVAGAGVSVELDSEHKRFKNASIVLAAVAPIPLVVTKAAEFLIGKEVSNESIEESANIARELASPIADMRGTIEHRKQLVFVLTKRSLTDAITRAKGGKVDGR